jgi:MFS family permease
VTTLPRTFNAGAINYTFRGVCILFAWLLWGDFVFTFFENIFGRFIPLYLKDLHASNSLIGIMNGSIAGGVNLLFLPSISQWSDRYRSRWGRRIPFLAVTAPLTVGAMLFMGFAPEIGAWVHGHLTAPILPGWSEPAVILGLLCLFVVWFHCSNMVLVNAFNWLLRDVVPQELMPRFLSWFKVVSVSSSIAFNWYVFPHIIDRRREVCIGVGLFYLIVFFLMCFNVKEGEYPPPPVEVRKPNLFRSFVTYFRECYAVPLYRAYFIGLMVSGFFSSASPFMLIFYRDDLKFSMDDLGKIFALGSVITALSYVPVGWLCEKFTAIKVMIFGQVGMATVSMLSCLFIRNEQTLVVSVVAGSMVAVCWGLGSGIFSMQLFPMARYGQLSAGANLFATGVGILSNYAIGVFMDATGNNYRLSYLWAALQVLSLIPFLIVYRGWKKHGGPDHYLAPLIP